MIGDENYRPSAPAGGTECAAFTVILQLLISETPKVVSR
jgi:hypothetical protein